MKVLGIIALVIVGIIILGALDINFGPLLGLAAIVLLVIFGVKALTGNKDGGSGNE